MAELKNGQTSVGIEKEDIIWKDRQRILFFARPWTFTKYHLTASRLFITKGFLHRSENEVRLYRIRDISYSQSLAERIWGVGTVKLVSTDATDPEIVLKHILNARDIKDIISQLVEKSRADNGVRTSEMIGGGPLGPRLFPDENHDGIDDRIQ